jgi:hypothetical protein
LIAVNDTYPIDQQLGYHGKSELPFFPHIPKFGKSFTLPNQIGALNADPAGLHGEVELVLSMIEPALKRGWIDVAGELSKAIKGALAVHVDDEATLFLSIYPTALQSALRVASSLSDLVGTYLLSEINVKRVYDIELETEKIVMCLRVKPSASHDAFGRETQILSDLDTRLSDDDKLRIAVRVK